MQRMKERDFGGLKVSGFLALTIGIALTMLCVIVVAENTTFGLLLAMLFFISQILWGSMRLGTKPSVMKSGEQASHLSGAFGQGKIGQTKFLRGFVAYVVIMGLFLFPADFDSNFELINFLSIIGLILINPILLKGLVKLELNEATILVLFGKYKGTIKENGFFWINPFYNTIKVSLRARNTTVEPLKVNDKAGNPIMIGAVLVWKIKDTYRAKFEIDVASSGAADIMKSAASFVETQSDAALRQIASSYTYDGEGELTTLRSASAEIDERLEEALNARLAIAGVEVLEARINYLAYAPEVAKIMLRRQQAEAIVTAREKIVEGAVGIVEKALTRLQKENTIKFDEYRRSVMTSNLLAVLCGNEKVRQV